jgi:lysophospholipase L1-like esterase
MVTAILILVAGELVARSLVDHREFSSADFYDVVGADKVSMMLETDWGPNLIRGFGELMKADPVLLWRCRPNLKRDASGIAMDMIGAGAKPNWHIQTDDRGFRLTMSSSSSSSPHIVGVGDSSTFGWGLDKPFLARLDVRTTNLGVPGYSSAQGRVLMNKALAELKPDVVTIAFGANDAHQVRSSDEATLHSRTTLIGRLRYSLIRTRLAMLVRDAIGPLNSRGGVERVSPSAFRDNLESMVSEVRALNARPVLIAWCANERWDDVMSELSIELRVPLIREPEIREHIRSERIANRTPTSVKVELESIYTSSTLDNYPVLYETNDGCHPSVWAHEVIATRLQSLIERL